MMLMKAIIRYNITIFYMQKTSYDSINWDLTNKAQQDPKYQIFLDWLIENGSCIDPSVKYPVAFGPRGYIGVATSSDIESYKAIISIPKSLIIDVDKVLQCEALKKVFLNNPHLFGQSDQQQNNFNMLALFLIYERAKGNTSFYKSYFDAAQCQNLILDWTEQDLAQLESAYISEQIIRYQKGMEAQTQDFLNVINSASDIFPTTISSQVYGQFFKWAFQFIMTRAFGWSVPQSYLIPFADMLNHGQPSIDHCIVDVLKQSSKGQDGYVFKSKKCNLSILKNDIITKKSERLVQIKKCKLSKRIKYLKKHKQYFEDQVTEDKSTEMMYQVAHHEFTSGKKRFRQLYLDSSSCTQDNDTDNSDIVSKEFNKEIIKIDDKQILRAKSKSLHSSLNDYWKTYTYKRIIPIITNNQEDALLVNLSENSSKSISEDSNVSKQDQYQWINESDPINIFFVLYTTTKYKKGDQLYNFYGKRPNKFFVIGYNFALLTNKYDSYGFKFFFNNHLMEPQEYSFNITEYLTQKNTTQASTTEVRLKRNKVSVELINHCRAMLLSKFSNKQNIYGIPVTIPVNKFLQEKVIQYCKQIVNFKLCSFKTTIQEDKKILQGEIGNNRFQTAVIVRLSYKIILTRQLEYLDLCIDVLRKWSERQFKFQVQEMSKIAKIKDYIYSLDRSQL